MTKSDIFESFVKIAQEKGMISEDAPEKAIKKLESNPRHDSLDISAIEALYGVKPDTPKDMQYKLNIMENAHPNSAIVAPSYDKLNGLVENNIERQNILINIVNKPVNGHLTNHKYAEHDLLTALVKIGNELDSHNNDELRVLADVCLENVCHTPLRKQAALPLLPIALIAGSIGALYVQQHLPMADSGYEEDYNHLTAELNDLANSNSDWGFGVEYTASFKKMIADLNGKLTAFNAAYQRVKPVITELERPKDSQELLKISQQPETQTVLKAYEALNNLFNKLLPYLLQVQQNFKNVNYKARQVQDKGVLNKVVDWTQALHGGKGLISDDMDDLARAIPPFIKSVSSIKSVLDTAKSYEAKAKQDLMLMQQQQQDAGPSTAAKPGAGVESIDQEAENLELPQE